MPNYNNGKIYTIRCRTDDTLIYVGSTIQPLCERFAGHKKDSRRERNKNILIYRTVNQEWDNWYIELHSLYPCNSKEELCRREGEIIREMGTLNMLINGRTREERYEENKGEIKEYYKKWYEENKEEMKEKYENNKEKILEQIKEKITCECGCIICKKHLIRHRKTKKHLNLMEQPTN